MTKTPGILWIKNKKSGRVLGGLQSVGKKKLKLQGGVRKKTVALSTKNYETVTKLFTPDEVRVVQAAVELVNDPEDKSKAEALALATAALPAKPRNPSKLRKVLTTTLRYTLPVLKGLAGSCAWNAATSLSPIPAVGYGSAYLCLSYFADRLKSPTGDGIAKMLPGFAGKIYTEIMKRPQLRETLLIAGVVIPLTYGKDFSAQSIQRLTSKARSLARRYFGPKTVEKLASLAMQETKANKAALRALRAARLH